MNNAIAERLQPFPIGLWIPPPVDRISLETYREIRDAGFTFVIGFKEIEHGEEAVIQALKTAAIVIVFASGKRLTIRLEPGEGRLISLAQ